MITFALLGAAAIAAEVLLLREAVAAFRGSELAVSLTLGLWLAWVSAGALAARAARSARWDRLFPASPALLLAGLAAGVVLFRAARAVLGVAPGLLPSVEGMAALAAVATAGPPFVVGFFFPVGVRRAGGPDALRAAFVAEAAGALAGGLLVTLLLPLLAGRGIPGFGALDRLRWEGMAPGFTHVETFETPHQAVSIGRDDGRVVVFTDGEIAGAFPDRATDEAAAGLVLSEHPAPRRVLLVGHAAAGLAEAMLEAPIDRLDHVELDPILHRRLLDAAGRPPPADPRYRFIAGDGRAHMRSAPGRYDLVVVALGDPSTALLNRFYTTEGLGEAAAALAEGGVVAFRLTASSDFVGADLGRYLASVWRSARRAFPHLAVSPGEALWIFGSARADAVSEDPLLLGARCARLGLSTPYAGPEHLALAFPADRVAFVRRTLDGYAADAPENRDARPVAHLLALSVWGRFTGSRFPSAAARAAEIAARLAWPAAAGLALVLLSLRRRPGALAVSILGSTGAASMGLSLLLLFVFQTGVGVLYGSIGLLTASFMAGLALGGLAGGRAAARGARPLAILAATEAALALFAGLLPFVLPAAMRLGEAAATGAFAALLLAAGALAGAEFPVAARAVSAARGGASAASTVEAVDHAGAAVGAVGVGLLLLPGMGTLGVLALLAAVKAAGSAAALVSGRDDRRRPSSCPGTLPENLG